ncbi:MAG: isochorismatase family protein [Cyanobacteria bacterium J06638_22]
MMKNFESSSLPLEEALKQPRKHRDVTLALQHMDNRSSTPGGPNGQPLSFWAAWDLKDRPRRIALLIDDCQEEYRPYAGEILPNIIKLVEAFRTARSTSDGVCITWSAWTRTFDDGISNAMDRWYGPQGLRPDSPENAVYVFTGAAGMKPISEIAPTEEEVVDGWFYHGKHLDMFWNFTEDGKSYLDEKLKAIDIDTIVIVGLWTDECILSTAYAGNSRGYDVVVVGDAVATATANQETALTIARGTVAKVLSTDDVIRYMENDFVTGEPGTVKGTQHPDGRKDG